LTVLLALLVGLAGGWWLGRRRPRRLERTLGLEKARLLGWIDAAPVGWMILDPGDGVQLINSRGEQLLGASGTALPAGQPLERICPAPELVALLQDTRQRNRSQRLVWPRGDQDLELLTLPGRDGWLSVVIQSRRSLEAQLEQQERWVSDVAHELRTPLTALLLVGDSLAAQVNSRNAVLVERLQRELLRLQELVNDLLQLSRLENAMPSESAPQPAVELNLLVGQVWNGLRPLADPRGVQLELAPAATAAGDGMRVRGEISRLHRLLYNLLDNALRYSPDGAPLTVNLRRSGDWCRLTVRDRGPGLSREDQERMFERFYRGDPSRARISRGGSGLGLAIVRQIALTYGGRVQATNHPEGGALLEVQLPLAG
jgi:two-component system phosphate regulon sensor histidine kinase PhoR